MPLTSDALVSLVASLTLEEKVQLLSGQTAWSTYAIPSIGLRNMVVADGPTGVRGVRRDERDPSLSLPSATCLAATWDTAALRLVGLLSALEARRKGVDVVLGPTINLHRSPRGGRHFEAYSEDPVLTGELAVAYVDGVQRHGVGACPKHYIANDSENDRFHMNSVVDEQTLRELYLAPFEDAITRTGAWMVMSAYNRTNGHSMSESPLLDDPLKSEWGFDGVVISDWTAVRSVDASADSGQDMVMPGPTTPWSRGLVDAVRGGRVPESRIDDKVLRMLRLANRVGALVSEPQPVPAIENPRAAIRALAAHGMVLVRNTGVLPIASDTKTLALIGAHAQRGRIMGGGSSTVLPFAPVSPMDGLTANALGALDVRFAVGAHVSDDLEPFPVAQVTTPSGERGVELMLLDANRNALLTEVRTASQFVVQDATIAVPTLSMLIRTRFTAVEAGLHRFGAASSRHIRVVVNGETLLDKAIEFTGSFDEEYSNPPKWHVEVPLEAGETIELEIETTTPKFDNLPYARCTFGFRAPRLTADAELEKAVALARESDIAVVMVGTTELVESEGYDRDNLRLPGRQDALVRAIAAVNQNTVVIVNAGAPVEMPWRNDVAAVLLCWFPGEEMGNALADVLYGVVEPGGRLPTSWPVDLASAPVSNTDPEPESLNVEYSEGLNIGYRAYAATGTEPAYWMGHGLGYTTWELLGVDAPEYVEHGEGATVSVTLRNTGERVGSTVVQVYLRRRDTAVTRPSHWLAGFVRVHADAGTWVTTNVEIDPRRFQHWADGAWANEPGDFELIVAKDASLRDGEHHTVAVR